MASKIVRRRSGIHGIGVFATAPIRKGEIVAQYRGRLVRREVADPRYANSMKTGHTFLFGLNDEWDLDANVGGNIARWVNHGCAGNCVAFVVGDPSRDPKKDRIFIEARRRIEPGEEILYDYGITLEVPHTRRVLKIWACRCGSKQCRGAMLTLKKPRKPKKA